MFKKTLVILSAILILSLFVGCTYALEDNSSQVSDTNVFELSGSNDLNNGKNISSSSYKSTVAEYSSLKEEYTSGNILYQVKAHDIAEYDGVKYNLPKYNSTIKLKVYTGSSFKYYNASIGNDGIASVKLPNLAVGNHKINVYVDGSLKGSSSVKILKSSTKVYAPVQTLKYNKNAYFKIRVMDSHNCLVKNVNLKVKVYTGKKYKTYNIKTDSKGFANLKTNNLSLGTHKIIIQSNSKKYSINKNSKVIIKKEIPKKARKLYAYADVKTVKYQSKDYYYITIKNEYAVGFKNVLLKVKVYTGNKYTTYKVKTDSKGIAKFNTNKLSLGSHKLNITSANKDYIINKASRIIVNESIVSNVLKPTKLSSLTFYLNDYGEHCAKLYWISKINTTYVILKKSDDDFKLAATVTANSERMSFFEKLSEDDMCVYSVSEIIENGTKKILGPYDSEGLKLISSPEVSVDFQNIKATISWSKVEGATKYAILRKVGREGKYESLAYVDASELSYVDYYYKSKEVLSKMMIGNALIDPSVNELFYTVRACTFKNVGGTDKKSYGLYLQDGDFHLEAPDIVSLQDNVLKWGGVPNAQGYLVLKREYSSDEWQTIGQINATADIVQSMELDSVDYNAYYSVQAYADKNGKTVYSFYDEGFTLKNRIEDNNYSILFFGDSITYGAPYSSGLSRHIFSMPYRVSQLTGCVYYNPSVPGAAYHNNTYNRTCIATEVVDQVAQGNPPARWQSFLNSKNSEGVSNTTIEDYDVVVLAAGANDYKTNAELGLLNDSNVSTFYGALNHILSKIEDASINRVNNGKQPIKVVFVDLHYGARVSSYKEVIVRDITSNEIGLTFAEYQDALDNIYDKWQASACLELYNFNSRDYDIVNSTNHPYTTSDNLHFTKFTYGQYGNYLAEFLVNEVFD